MPQLFKLVKQSMWDRDHLSIFGFYPLIFRTDSDINVFSTLHFSCISPHILSSWGALCFIFPFHFICGHCMIWNTLHIAQQPKMWFASWAAPLSTSLRLDLVPLALQTLACSGFSPGGEGFWCDVDLMRGHYCTETMKAVMISKWI